jgi:hypothetical protein
MSPIIFKIDRDKCPKTAKRKESANFFDERHQFFACAMSHILTQEDGAGHQRPLDLERCDDWGLNWIERQVATREKPRIKSAAFLLR